MGIDLSDVGLGIGLGLSKAGEIKDSRRKEELAERLEKEREERADTRDVAREERARKREAARVAKTRPIERDGAIYEQQLNSDGEVIRESLADKLTAEGVNTERESRRVQLNNDVLTGKGLETRIARENLEMEYLPKKYSLDAALTGSQIDENRAQAARAARPATGRAEDPSKTEANEILRSARAQIGRSKPDGTKVTAEEVAAILRARGYPKLADVLYKATTDEGSLD